MRDVQHITHMWNFNDVYRRRRRRRSCTTDEHTCERFPPSAGSDESESLGFYGDARLLNVFLDVPVDKRTLSGRMISY